MTIYQDKSSGKRVTIPMGAPLRRAIESQTRGTPNARVFHRRDGAGFTDREVQRAFAVARKIAKLRPELTPHSLRHTFASWLVMKGTPLRTVQELLRSLGHPDDDPLRAPFAGTPGCSGDGNRDVRRAATRRDEIAE